MLATLTGAVLAAVPRPPSQDGKKYVDVYLLQAGERQPVIAWAEAESLPYVPTVGEVVDADVTVFLSKFNGGSLSVKVTALRSAA